MSLEDLSAADAASAIRNGSLSPVEYVHDLLARVDEVESRVKAFVTIDRETLLAEARQLEAEAHNKQFRGPLHGVPVAIKDMFYTRKLCTTMGTTAFSDFIPTYDAQVVKKLRHAGALIMGKSVTTIFVFLDPGPTRN